MKDELKKKETKWTKFKRWFVKNSELIFGCLVAGGTCALTGMIAHRLGRDSGYLDGCNDTFNSLITDAGLPEAVNDRKNLLMNFATQDQLTDTPEGYKCGSIGFMYPIKKDEDEA